MSYICTMHGWQHSYQRCPDCPSLSGTSSSEAGIIAVTPKPLVTEQDYLELKKHADALAEELKNISKYLDGIEYELEASVYTVTDDEFGTVFFCRDIADKALASYQSFTQRMGE